MTQWTDTDPEEEGLPPELEGSIGALRKYRGRCPEPALLEAARAGVVPDDVAASLADHTSRCRSCQILARDLADPDVTTPTESEVARIRAKVFGGRASWHPASAGQRGSAWLVLAAWFRWSWRPAIAVATFVAVAAAVVWRVQDPPRPPEVAVARQVPAPRSHPVLVLEKPPVTMPLATVLIWRSEPGKAQDPYLEALGHALTPYRADDFAEAARRLQAVARDHPTAEVSFYLGVCRIFLGQEDLAIADLGRARERAQATLARETTWYLAVAYERAGRPDAAAAELATLCGEAGERQATACYALRDGLLPGSASRPRR